MGGNFYTDIYLLINIIISAQDPILKYAYARQSIEISYIYVYIFD